MRVRSVRRWSCSRSAASMAASGVFSIAGSYDRGIPTVAPGGYRRQVPTFACFDVETTGLDPAGGHVIEVAVVRIRHDGTMVGEWTTLVDAGAADRAAAASRSASGRVRLSMKRSVASISARWRNSRAAWVSS